MVAFGANRRYIAAAEAELGREQARHPCGWVLDRRGDTGHALYPMLIGVQPLLGAEYWATSQNACSARQPASQVGQR